MKKPGKQQELTTSAQITAWRQRLEVILSISLEKNENKITADKYHKELEGMKDKIDSKNTYIHYFKREDVKDEGPKKERFLYDIAKGDTDQNYCQKCKYESKWCPHRKQREDAKQRLGSALTT